MLVVPFIIPQKNSQSSLEYTDSASAGRFRWAAIWLFWFPAPAPVLAFPQSFVAPSLRHVLTFCRIKHSQTAWPHNYLNKGPTTKAKFCILFRYPYCLYSSA